MADGSFTSPLLLVTAGVAYPLAVRGTGDDVIASAHLQFCASVDIEIIAVGGTKIITTPSVAQVFFGGPPALGYSSAVTSSAYNLLLDGTTNTSDTFALGADHCNDVDLSLCYLTSDTANVLVAINPRQV